ncbi:MAG TPA: FkbM family methyltransferase [Methylomirabilota bacterium]|jgi:FkbM family methyltransferase|nr:FkbM family methyltransferase [Methylomirabilota bacterium]
MRSFYRSFVQPGDLCYDIGANSGDRTEIFLSLGARVLAVEPQATCLAVLRKRFGQNPSFSLEACAIGSAVSEAELLLCDENSECATLSGEFVRFYSAFQGLHWGKSERVKVRPLEALIGQYGLPGFCKIDVEGFEPEVFRGLRTPLPCVAFEANRPFLEDTRTCIDLLNRRGSYAFNFMKYEHMKLELAEWMRGPAFLERLDAVIPAEVLTGEVFARRQT